MEAITCDDDREAAITNWQLVSSIPRDIAQARLPGGLTGLFEHGRGQVDTRRQAHMRCESTNHETRTASDIKHAIVRSRRGGFDD